MKLVYPEIQHVFDTEGGSIPTLVIENQPLLYRLLCDIRGQLDGSDGKCVVSDGGKVLALDRHLELITEFVPFSVNQKPLLNKAAAALEKAVMEGDLYGEAMRVLREAETFLLKAAFDFRCDLTFPKLSFSSLLKAAGMEFREDYDSLPEKVLDYMELVTEFERKKLFVLYNFRSVISDREAEIFLETALRHGYNIVMIDSREHARLPNERRYIVDAALCEIC